MNKTLMFSENGHLYLVVGRKSSTMKTKMKEFGNAIMKIEFKNNDIIVFRILKS